ncbi:MAG TPA: antibiotic biosynthesis monooxygenase [Puia sp.]|nr:antibiotic biosynthesis monooxygenase [Puia sp.]
MNSFLIISGQIGQSKKKEFEQTFRLAFSVKGEDCIAYNLSADISKEGYYHFFSLWTSDEALQRFMKSTEYELMNGAFHALGHVDQYFTGNVSETKNLIKSNGT